MLRNSPSVSFNYLRHYSWMRIAWHSLGQNGLFDHHPFTRSKTGAQRLQNAAHQVNFDSIYQIYLYLQEGQGLQHAAASPLANLLLNCITSSRENVLPPFVHGWGKPVADLASQWKQLRRRTCCSHRWCCLKTVGKMNCCP